MARAATPVTSSTTGNETEATSTHVGIGRALAFGVGSVGTTTFIIVPQLLLLFYMTELLAIPAGWAGAALLLPKVWELLTDPYIGWRSDRTTTRWGRRRPYLLVGALLLPVAFAAMFAAPALQGWPARLAFVTLAYLVATTAYSVFAVPYVTLTGEFSKHPDERTRLVAFRMAFVAVGILIAGALGPWLIDRWDGDRAAYAGMGLVLALAAGACMLSAFAAASTARVEPGVHGAAPLAVQLRGVWAAPRFRSLWSAYIVQMASNGANAAMLAYAARYLLGAGEALVGLFFAVFTLASLAATPAFALLGRRTGRLQGFRQATWIYAASLALLAVAVQGGDAVLLASAALAGVGNAGTQLFAFALLPEVIDADGAVAGIAGEGVFTGVWIAGEKLGLALGAAAAGLVLDLAGFVEGGAATQPPGALAAVLLLFSIVPALLMAGSLAFLANSHWRLHAR